MVCLWRGNHTMAVKTKFRTRLCPSQASNSELKGGKSVAYQSQWQECPNPSTPSHSSFMRLSPTPSWPSSLHYNHVWYAAIVYFQHLHINYLVYPSGFFPDWPYFLNKCISLLKANITPYVPSISFQGPVMCQVHSKHAVNNYHIGL